MNKKIVLAIFGMLIVTALVGAARAQINVTITITDANNNPLGSTVPLGTTVYVHAFYQDIAGGAPASAVLEMDYNGTVPITKTTLYSGTVTSGQTITKSATLTKPGSYAFKWTCTQGATSSSLGATASGSKGPSIEPQCIIRVGYVTATVNIPLPEPGTLAGLIMALSAFGLLAVKKAKH
jgi:hypothetical protein